MQILAGAERELAHTSAQLRALSPAATLDRGYALVRRTADGSIVRDPAGVDAGDELAIRVAGGSFPATAGARDPRSV